MKLALKYFYLLLLWSTITLAQQQTDPIAVLKGVSLELATYRQSIISNIQYALHFNIPAVKNIEIEGVEKLRFNLSAVNQPLQLDFKQTPDHIKSIVVNGAKTPVIWNNEHILIDQEYLRAAANEIIIHFIAGNESLNRNDDYLYALFVPAHARTVFPCFDQPDLKANFLLTLTVPLDWKVLANGAKKDSVISNDRLTYNFEKSDKLPTYLFSFTAGKYTQIKQTHENRSMVFLHRETDARKISLSVDSIFKGHSDANSFMEQWTGIPYPFQKFAFVAIPDFQFGGMEHPGEIQYKAASLFLDDGATKDQFIARSSLISHETAHMWFGDLVTMKWFNDVWMKEVFANFMADKVTEKVMGQETFNLKFLQDHYPAAYGVDRTRGANPIRQQLDNLQDAGAMYGNIIYHKAPIMMRQLELLMGKDNFQKGVREYLLQYAYHNATWNDLIAILSKYSKANLYNWNKVWVNQPGRPVFDYRLSFKGNKISNLVISQQPEVGQKRIWQQVFSITLVYPTYKKTFPLNMNREKIVLKEVAGLDKPLYILFNSDGLGYGLFPTEKVMTAGLFDLESPVERASAYINAYENMLAGRSFNAIALLKLFEQGIGVEKNEMNLKLLTGYISTIYWEFISQKDRIALGPVLEKALWTAMEKQTQSNHKKIFFGAYQAVYLSADAAERMYKVWLNQEAPAGVKLIEDDYTALALTIALKTDTVNSVLIQQRGRIKNSERQNRLSFIMPALSLNVKERDSFFYSLRLRKNRQKEAWVTVALSYLHHPLKQNTSVKYLPESLELLEEIQKTGDIFFPQSWLAAIFGNYQSKQALQVVNDFLNNHPEYNSKLKDKILQNTDQLYRAQKIIEPGK